MNPPPNRTLKNSRPGTVYISLVFRQIKGPGKVGIKKMDGCACLLRCAGSILSRTIERDEIVLDAKVECEKTGRQYGAGQISLDRFRQSRVAECESVKFLPCIDIRRLQIEPIALNAKACCAIELIGADATGKREMGLIQWSPLDRNNLRLLLRDDRIRKNLPTRRHIAVKRQKAKRRSDRSARKKRVADVGGIDTAEHKRTHSIDSRFEADAARRKVMRSIKHICRQSKIDVIIACNQKTAAQVPLETSSGLKMPRIHSGAYYKHGPGCRHIQR